MASRRSLVSEPPRQPLPLVQLPPSRTSVAVAVAAAAGGASSRRRSARARSGYPATGRARVDSRSPGTAASQRPDPTTSDSSCRLARWSTVATWIADVAAAAGAAACRPGDWENLRPRRPSRRGRRTCSDGCSVLANRCCRG